MFMEIFKTVQHKNQVQHRYCKKLEKSLTGILRIRHICRKFSLPGKEIDNLNPAEKQVKQGNHRRKADCR